MKLLTFFTIFGAGLLGLLFITYVIVNPLSSFTSTVNFPYAMSIHPQMIYKDDNVNISISSLDNTDEEVVISVITPNAMVYSRPITLTGTQITMFPAQFDVPFTLIAGNYSVILTSGETRERLVSSSFNVVTDVPPDAYAFGSFALGVALPITIPLTIAIITIGYQVVHNRNTDRSRKLEEKSRWMANNVKYFFNLINPVNKIYEVLIQQERKEQEDINTSNSQGAMEKRIIDRKALSVKTLNEMVEFYDQYLNSFKANTRVYFFDDAQSESFAYATHKKILEYYDKIFEEYFKDRHILANFVNLSSQQRKEDREFEKCSYAVYSWLDNSTNRCNFIDMHLAFYWTVYTAVNEGFLANYTDSRKLLTDVKLRIRTRNKELRLEKAFENANQQIYGDRQSDYFQLRLNKTVLLSKRNVGIIDKLKQFFSSNKKRSE